MFARKTDPMPQDIEAVIFDCDGTLVDSEVLSIETLVSYASEYGLRMEVDEAVGLFAGGQLENAVTEMERRMESTLPDDFVETFRLKQAEAFKSRPVAAVDGAAELLSKMRLPFCMASNAPRKKITLNLELTKLDRFFNSDQLFSAYDRQIYKPDPDLFLRAAEYLGVLPEKCAVVEDTQFGIEAGLSAGMQVFAYAPHADPPHVERIRTVRHLSELGGHFH